MKAPFKYLTFFVLLLFNLRLPAATYYITDGSDTTNITSLRGAVIASNKKGGRNTIILAPNPKFNFSTVFFSLTIPGTDEDAARTGDLNITRGNLTIMGADTNIVIDGFDLGDRLFKISPGAHLTLENLTLAAGNADGPNYGTNYDGESGGIIYNEGTLEVGRCVLEFGATGNGQSGIYSTGGKGGDGGAIYNGGQLLIWQTYIWGNNCGLGSVNAFTGAGGNGGNGGGIYNAGSMTMNDCTITGAWSGPGTNGVFPPPAWVAGGGVLSINPEAPGVSGGNGGDGAGIYNAGKATINFSTIYSTFCGNGGNGSNGDGAGNGGVGGNGGGIFNTGKLAINTCTIYSNGTGLGGTGGDGYYDGSGGNGGDAGCGGGICNNGTFNSTSCTIAFNLANAGGNGGNSYSFTIGTYVPPGIGGMGGVGGGIFNNLEDTNATTRNTMIAINDAFFGGNGGTNYGGSTNPIVGPSGSNGTGFDVAGDFTSGGFNLISWIDGGTGFTNGSNNDLVGDDAHFMDPLLGFIQMNGGLTPTLALQWGSVGIDQGNSFGVHQDQRGKLRPYKYSSLSRPPGGDGSDIGAYELRP
jgi:hypothetical protein